MQIIKKIKDLILPKNIDFFGSLHKQSLYTSKIVDELIAFYLENPSEMQSKQIFELIERTKNLRKENLIELNNALITPVDKEAISRAYIHLHWIVLSIKHLVVEMNTYQIYSLKNNHKILEYLQKEMQELTTGFAMLNKKKYQEILLVIANIIHLDDELIKEYASILSSLFHKNNTETIMKYREIFSQLKEISKRIHFCGNQLEDIVFKLN